MFFMFYTFFLFSIVCRARHTELPWKQLSGWNIPKWFWWKVWVFGHIFSQVAGTHTQQLGHAVWRDTARNVRKQTFALPLHGAAHLVLHTWCSKPFLIELWRERTRHPQHNLVHKWISRWKLTRVSFSLLVTTRMFVKKRTIFRFDSLFLGLFS